MVNAGYLPATLNLGGLVFQVIASDGRPLANPIQSNRFQVAPGERYDLLLTLPANGTYGARVDYLNIRGTASLGNAFTVIQVV